MEVISKIQEDILQKFCLSPDSKQFYLTGGTALAHFYLKHRKSRDLDFFTPEAGILLPYSREFQASLVDRGYSVEQYRRLNSAVDLIVSRGQESTMVQFAQDARLRLEATKEFANYPGLRVDNLRDIAANKLLALFGRALPRDFVDVYYLVREAGFKKEEMMELAKKKDPGFDLYWLGVAFDRAKAVNESAPDTLLLLRPPDMKELQDFFVSWRAAIAAQLSP